MNQHSINQVAGMRHRRKGGLPKKEPTPAQGMRVYHEQWVDYLERQNYAKKSIELYHYSNQHFLNWAEARQLDDPTLIDKPLLESFQRHLFRYRKANNEPLSINSVRRTLGVLKSFFDYLCKHDVLSANPASIIELPRKPKRHLPRVLSRDNLRRILGEPDLTSVLGLRDRAILEVLYATGIRRSELVNLDLADFDESELTLLIRQGKGGKDRLVPIAKKPAHWLANYLNQSRPTLASKPHEKALFISGYGERISSQYLGNWVAKLFKKLNIEVPNACHAFRHSIATHLIENGCSLNVVKELLGHEDLSSTGIYTKVAIKHIAESYHQHFEP